MGGRRYREPLRTGMRRWWSTLLLATKKVDPDVKATTSKYDMGQTPLSFSAKELARGSSQAAVRNRPSRGELQG